jgi:hypothetical protein
MVELADVIADLLHAATPFSLEGRKGELRRAKVDFKSWKTPSCACAPGREGRDRLRAGEDTATRISITWTITMTGRRGRWPSTCCGERACASS